MKEHDQAYDEGWAAYEDCLGLCDNPYDPEEDEHLSWNDGYLAAEDEYLTGE